MDESGEMEPRHEVIINSLRWAFGSHEVAARIHIEPLAQKLIEDPASALDLVVETYHRALNDAYTDDVTGENHRSFVQAIAGGPFEHIPRVTSNAIGMVYPFLPREIKNKALTKLLEIYDGLNYMQVNGGSAAGITPGIREPLLLSDIEVCRWMYWPGLDQDNQRLLSKYKLFCDFKSEAIAENGMFNQDIVLSDFIVAYSLLRSDMNNGWGEDYLAVANPDFLDNVLKGIVGMRFATMDGVKRFVEDNSGEVKELYGDVLIVQSRIDDKMAKDMNRLEELLPISVHHRVHELFSEKDWVDYLLFEKYPRTQILERYIKDLVSGEY